MIITLRLENMQKKRMTYFGSNAREHQQDKKNLDGAKDVGAIYHSRFQLSWKKHLDTEGEDWRMITADEDQREGFHPMGEIQSKEKSDVIRSLSDVIRVKGPFSGL
jgi:hypothetical protein